LAEKAENIDYLEMKVTIDSLIDPKADANKTRSEIENMISDVAAMLSPDDTDFEKIQKLKKYIYEGGEWNNNKPFSYDMDDPQGISRTSRLLHEYLRTRKGNCVSMPILYAILGQGIGLDMTISTAPEHIFVHYIDADGNRVNLEATSGGHQARDAWYQENLPMTETAIENGVFLKKLSNKEALAVMAHDLASHLLREKSPKETILVSEKLIELYPEYAPLYMVRGSAYSRYMQKEFQSKYPNQDDVPEERRPELQYLLQQNIYSFEIADDLGWRDPDELAIERKSQPK